MRFTFFSGVQVYRRTRVLRIFVGDCQGNANRNTFYEALVLRLLDIEIRGRGTRDMRKEAGRERQKQDNRAREDG